MNIIDTLGTIYFLGLFFSYLFLVDLLSWQEIDELFQKLFDKTVKEETESNGKEQMPLSRPTEAFVDWLESYIKEEQFYNTRMICLYCGMKIEDDKYVVMCHPEHPNDSILQIYFHSKGACNPRQRLLQQRRERWLKDYEEKSRKKMLTDANRK